MYTPDLFVSNQKESPQQEPAILSDPTSPEFVEALQQAFAYTEGGEYE
jgi:hypothetical protein